MKINYYILLILVLATVTFYGVFADLEDSANLKSKDLLLKNNVTDAGVTKPVDPLKKGKDTNDKKDDSTDGLESKNGLKNDKEKAKGNVVEHEPEEHNKLNSESREVLPVKEKCDSSSNSCTDDDKMLVACLRVPGNDSPDLSLLIQNKGKVPLTVTISAPGLVQLEKKQIELQQKEESEIKVSIKGVETGHSIILTAGHGNCSLDFRDQFVGRKQIDDTSESTHKKVAERTFGIVFFFLAALLMCILSVLMCMKLWRHYLRKGPEYQMLNMELPVSHGSKVEPAVSEEGWDSWGDNWDDEEAPKTPTFPVTPSLSSKGMFSRKISKESWKD